MKPKMPVTKAIIPAAGLGTRFLPWTKAMPKEMLPIIDKPVIQLVVEDAVAAGVTDIIIVTGPTKRGIEDHFDRSDAMESDLIEKGKVEQAGIIKEIGEIANFVYVRQKGNPKGNARPILNARHLIDDDEPFFVFAADDFFSGGTLGKSRAQQMIEAYNKTGKTIVGLAEINREDSSKYGVAELGENLGDGLYELKGTVEKPKPEDAPSNFMIPMAYLLTPDIWPLLKREKVDDNGEIVTLESINDMMEATGEKVYGQVIDGTYRDTGSPIKYLETLFSITLEHPELGPDMWNYVRRKAQEQKDAQ